MNSKRRFPQIGRVFSPFFVILLLPLFFPGPVSADGEPLGLVVYTKGQAHLVHGGKKQNLQKDTLVGAGDSLQTTANGHITVQFRTGVIFRVGPRSNVKVKTLAANAVRMSVSGGSLGTRLRRPGDYRIDIETPTAVAGVRGTDVIVEVNEEKKESKVMVDKGVVEVTDSKGENKTAVEAGTKVTATTTGLQKGILEAFEKQKFEIFQQFEKEKRKNIEMLIEQKRRNRELMEQQQKMFQ